MRRDSALSFLAAFLLHASLFFAAFWHYSYHTKTEKVSLVIDAYIISEVQQQAQKHKQEHHKDLEKNHSERHHQEKNGTHEAKQTEEEAQHSSHQHEATRIEPIYKPLPEIPQDLRYEAFRCDVIARFNIKSDGSATVELVQPCENPTLNYLLLKSLKQWRFEPSNTERKRDIKVNFRVD